MVNVLAWRTLAGGNRPTTASCCQEVTPLTLSGALRHRPDGLKRFEVVRALKPHATWTDGAVRRPPRSQPVRTEFETVPSDAGN